MAKRARAGTTIAKTKGPLLGSKLRIVAIGDTFAERYIWAGAPKLNEPGVPEMPYLAPDELRARAYSETFIEVSGTPLHQQIYETFLAEFGYDSKMVSVESVPSRDDIAEALAMSAHPNIWNNKAGTLSNDQLRKLLLETMKSESFPLDGSRSPFPVFLHELRAYSTKQRTGDCSATKDEGLVWRISQTHGEVRDSRPSLDGEKYIIQRIQDWMKKEIPRLKSPTVFVICDRNTRKGEVGRGMRSGMDNSFLKELMELASGTGPESASNSLVLWHTRIPFHHDNGIGEYLTGAAYRRDRVIPIVNAQCLRAAGVPLRFDVAFETTLRQILESRSHDAIEFLLKFPHAIIRFDYGVIHLSAHKDKLIGLDIHAFNAGPDTTSPEKQGMMAGMTPLLISAILLEISRFLERWPERVAKAPALAAESPLGEFLNNKTISKFAHPTLRNPTPLDRAIDLGLLLGNMHFLRGYGDSKNRPFTGHPGVKPLSTSSADQYKQLAKELAVSLPYLKAEHVDGDDSFTLELDTTNSKSLRETGKLARISMPEDCFAGSPVNTFQNAEQFSRAKLISDPEYMLKIADVPLSDEYLGVLATHLPDDCSKILMRIVTHGLHHVLERNTHLSKGVELRKEPGIAIPFVSFGNYRTIDSHEIDEFVEVRYLVEKYVSQKDWTTPLAIAVFGKPGSGKSTIVREILGAVKGCQLERSLETNVSQWTDTRNLTRQLHRIRDFTMDGREDGSVPAAFFDEFDTPCDGKEVGWLRYFLMPLQDGLYMDADDKFHVGKSIFVFAGGVSHTYAEFKSKFGDRNDDKVPDFIGRLRAHINVAGLDLPTTESTGVVLRVKIRRAVLLRNLLLKNMKQIFDHSQHASIAPNIVMAILNAPKFEHGVRSMEAIVQMSRVPKGAHSFQPSAMPPCTQLEPHVDADEFMKYFRQQ